MSQISDFGLAKLMPEGQDTCVTARVLGTFGYFDPEYTLVGNCKQKFYILISEKEPKTLFLLDNTQNFLVSHRSSKAIGKTIEDFFLLANNKQNKNEN